MNIKPSDLDKIKPGELKNLARRGMLQISMDIPLSTIQDMTKKETPEYQKHSKLSGHTISISQASRKYNIPHSTITRWVQHGYITKLGMDKNRVLLDEIDVAYCAEIYRQRPGQGNWLFNSDGTPYSPRNC